jgi:hypothetical protein
MAGPPIRIGALEARQSRDGDGRFGKECWLVRFDQHRGVASAGAQDSAKVGHSQEFPTKI